MKPKSPYCPLCNSSKNTIIYASDIHKDTSRNKFLINEVFEDYKKVLEL